MTASPNGSNIMSQLSGSPNNASDYYQHKSEIQPAPITAPLASTAFYDQVGTFNFNSLTGLKYLGKGFALFRLP